MNLRASAYPFGTAPLLMGAPLAMLGRPGFFEAFIGSLIESTQKISLRELRKAFLLRVDPKRDHVDAKVIGGVVPFAI